MFLCSEIAKSRAAEAFAITARDFCNFYVIRDENDFLPIREKTGKV